jgi:UrcA family protein
MANQPSNAAAALSFPQRLCSKERASPPFVETAFGKPARITAGENIMSKFHALLTVTVAVALAAPAIASSNAAPVRYQDLNLASTADRATLDARLSNASMQLCRDHGARDRESRRLARECRAAALSDARQKAQVVVARTARDQQLALAE